jgi:peptidoglycan/xylan/chitin deacetylase (PgdA/CDA1 family)
MIALYLASAAAVAAAGWNSMAPRSQIYGRTFVGVNHKSRLLALTYDDGPSEAWTPRLLEVLARHDVRATFFMLGRYAAQSPEIARAVAAAGHVIGNHTYTHPNLIFCSSGQVQAQLDECDRVLTDVVGEHSKLFRPPFGGRRPDVLRTVRARGFVPVMWSVTAHDWNPVPPEKIEEKVARQIRGGDVILMHDGGHLSPTADRSATVTATDHIISRYKGEGYRFVTVPEMMEASGSVSH